MENLNIYFKRVAEHLAAMFGEEAEVTYGFIEVEETGKSGPGISIVTKDYKAAFLDSDFHSLMRTYTPEALAKTLSEKLFGSLASLPKLEKGNFPQIKGCLGLRLIDMNDPVSKDYVSMTVAGNIAVACTININDFVGAYITKENAADLGVSENDLLTAALTKAPENFPVKFESLASRVGEKDDPEGPLVVTTEDGQNGAAIFYPGVLDKLFLQFNGPFFVVPRCIHEFLCVPDLTQRAEERDGLCEFLSNLHHAELDANDKSGYVSETIFYYNGYGLSEYKKAS